MKTDCPDRETEGHKCSDVCYAEPVKPYGGAHSWAELDGHLSLAEQEEAVYQARALIGGIFDDSDIEIGEKARLILAIVNELPSRVREAAEKEGIVDKVKRTVKHILGKDAPIEPDLTDDEDNIFSVSKDASGQWRWVGLVSNNFYDRDGEVFSEAAHREFVDYVDRTGDAPELWGWHTPGSKVGRADFIEFSDNFLVLSGTFDEDATDIAKNLAKSGPLRMSHGYRYKDADLVNGIYSKYRMFEASFLPPSAAANVLTSFALEEFTKEVEMRAEKKVFLVEKYGQERADKIEAGVAAVSKELIGAGIAWKDASPESVADPPNPPPPGQALPEQTPTPEPGPAPSPSNPADPKTVTTTETDDDGTATTTTTEDADADEENKGVSQLLEGIKAIREKTDLIDGLTADISSIKDRLADVEKTFDQRVAEALTPRKKQAVDSSGRPTDSNGNVLDGDRVKEVLAGQGVKDDGAPVNPAQGYVDDFLRSNGVSA